MLSSARAGDKHRYTLLPVTSPALYQGDRFEQGPPTQRKKPFWFVVAGPIAVLLAVLVVVKSATLLQVARSSQSEATQSSAAQPPGSESVVRLSSSPVNPQAEVDFSEDKLDLPACDRTLVYQFAGAHGFASEYLIFLRVALLARVYNYTLFIDDSRWNYGRWSE